ncbi:MAG: T9SS type A sorting domain-containing protein, partial [Ignavibacteria bacterium]|nr:T9SS type A sorting domain-containing protein [Ignavibacteria bacterium]
TLPANGTSQATITISPKNNSDTLLASGLQVILSNTGAGSLSSVTDLGDGTYQTTITAPIAIGTDTISASVISGTDTVSIFWNAVVTYVNPTSVNENPISPDKFYLYQNSPNPFNPSTIIKYTIPSVIATPLKRGKQSQFVTLKVYDVLGNEIAILVNEEVSAGTYETNFNATELSSGIYFYKLQAGDFVETKKMILMK